MLLRANKADAIAQLDRLLNSQKSHPKLVGSDGQEMSIPESVYQLLRDIVHAIASGESIHLIPHNHPLTTQEAADILNVSRPFLVKLLQSGEIPFIKVGKHRRIYWEDLMNYKDKRDQNRRQLLDELIEVTEASDLYEIDDLSHI
jgi:excisionase family DNA binding protein